MYKPHDFIYSFTPEFIMIKLIQSYCMHKIERLSSLDIYVN